MKKVLASLAKPILRKAGFALLRIQTGDFQAVLSDKAGGFLKVEFFRHVFGRAFRTGLLVS